MKAAEPHVEKLRLIDKYRYLGFGNKDIIKEL